MNRILSTAGWLVVAAALTIGMTACSGSEDIADSQQLPAGEAAPKTFTMTIVASKGGDATRALGTSTDGKSLSATWTEGDVVEVMSYEDPYIHIGQTSQGGQEVTKYGTLTATISGNTTVLTGVVTGNIAAGTDLTLKYLSDNYNEQDGTLGYIAGHCDYAKANVRVAGYETGNDGIPKLTFTESTVVFENQQAVVRFSLNDAGGQPLAVKHLDITAPRTYYSIDDGNNVTTSQVQKTYSISPATATNELYAAIPLSKNAKVLLDATLADNSHLYYLKNSATFDKGKFYTVDVNMKMGTVNLADLTDDYTAEDGDILYGDLPDDLKLSIKANAKVTLNGVTVYGGEVESGNPWPAITCLGKATITLGGSNFVATDKDNVAGIDIPSNKTLTIRGNGTLDAVGGFGSAGIGGNRTNNCGNIKIEGGTVIARGGEGAAGIGSGSGSSASYGAITISGGTVEARGGYGGAGIGSGSGSSAASYGAITISGGSVKAKGGAYAAGIGSGNEGGCGDITIGSGIARVTAIKGEEALAPIGKGRNGYCGTVTVDGVENWPGTGTTNLNFAISTTDDTNDTWTLTHK